MLGVLKGEQYKPALVNTVPFLWLLLITSQLIFMKINIKTNEWFWQVYIIFIVYVSMLYNTIQQGCTLQHCSTLWYSENLSQDRQTSVGQWRFSRLIQRPFFTKKINRENRSLLINIKRSYSLAQYYSLWNEIWQFICLSKPDNWEERALSWLFSFCTILRKQSWSASW